ncbi:phosphate ABC transporter permease [Brevibacterium ravenspurgense]|uniref:Transport permease protein n=1 Tax=Brevibacterium ravenspurgense TaxID=479117 RepID=A0A2I1IHE3_9MICO|nr:ABC transporter permease [Brevibacterium ravenspurgense]PKY70543.1 phosphate ABC transporter permease [Brevibacterium ravenspurgense]
MTESLSAEAAAPPWRSPITVPSWTLREVGKRAPLGTYFGQLWQRRHFILAESRAKVAGGARRNVLGSVWLVLSPLLNGLAFFFIFGYVLNTSRGIENFVGYLVIGVFFFQFTMRSVTQGAKAIQAGQSMIRAFSFPRASMPISVVVRETMNFVPTFVVMLVIILAFPPAENITWRVVLIVPCFIMQICFAQGCAFIVARLCHEIPDFINVIQVAARFWLYASGVFFSIERFVDKPVLAAIMKINPMYSYLQVVRNSLLYGVDSPVWMWMLVFGWGIACLLLGFLYFYFGEEKYGRV